MLLLAAAGKRGVVTYCRLSHLGCTFKETFETSWKAGLRFDFKENAIQKEIVGNAWSPVFSRVTASVTVQRRTASNMSNVMECFGVGQKIGHIGI